MTPEGDETVMEPNLYLSTLRSAKTTVIDCGEKVYSGYGSPLDAITTPLATGGWVCKEADEWIADLKGQCSGIMEAFDDAVATIQTAISDQEDEPEVPEGDWRGHRWPRQWAHRQMY